MGGVGDHTAALAAALAASGERVHVWCPGAGESCVLDAVHVHRVLRRLGSSDLARLSCALDAYPAPRRLLVQWVPHAFKRRSLNLGFCRWLLRRRTRAHDEIDIIIHEPFLPFRGGVRVLGAAMVHRLMMKYLLRSATRVWVVTPAWTKYVEPYSGGRDLGFRWVPVPSTVPVAPTTDGGALRGRLVAADGLLIAAFATGERYAVDALRRAVLPLIAGDPRVHLLLLGRRSDTLRAALVEGAPACAPRVHATGPLSALDLSRHLDACDLGVQPYADGVCGRQTSAMAFLAHRRPLVTTDGRFTEPVWRESRAVVLVPADCPGGLTLAVRNLLDHTVERTRLAEAARALYESRFAIGHTAAALHAHMAQPCG